MSNEKLRQLPSVDKLLGQEAVQALVVAYGHDQAGNRTSLTYPGGGTLAYTHTNLNQVDTVPLNSQPLQSGKDVVDS